MALNKPGRSHTISEMGREKERVRKAAERSKAIADFSKFEPRTEAEGRLQTFLVDFLDGPASEMRSFFDHAGLEHVLQAAASGDIWTPFRDHYTTGGEIDEERVATDFATWPPIASRVVELQLERRRAGLK